MPCNPASSLERATGIEPATSSLGISLRWCHELLGLRPGPPNLTPCHSFSRNLGSIPGSRRRAGVPKPQWAWANRWRELYGTLTPCSRSRRWISWSDAGRRSATPRSAPAATRAALRAQPAARRASPALRARRRRADPRVGGGAPRRRPTAPARRHVLGDGLPVDAGAPGDGAYALASAVPAPDFPQFDHTQLPIGHGDLPRGSRPRPSSRLGPGGGERF